MKQDGTIARSQLLVLLETASPGVNSGDAIAAVAAANTDELWFSLTPAEEIRQIYEHRRRRMVLDHPTRPAVETLLAGLASYSGAYVATVTLAVGKRINSVWLTEGLDSVLAVISADDHR